MDSAFYSCVDDTIEDAFDASSDTEPADSNASITPLPNHTRLDSKPRHRETDEDDQSAFGVRNCHAASDWSTNSQHLSKDNVLQGNSAVNSDSRRLLPTGSLRLPQSLADSKHSSNVTDNTPPNSGLSMTDVYSTELPQQRTSRCRDNLYVSKSDSSGSRQSLLKSKSVTESGGGSRLHMSKATLPPTSTNRVTSAMSTNRVASAMYLPDDKVMEIVEEQLENDDDDDDEDADSEDEVEEEEEDVAMATMKPVSVADEDDEVVDSDADESEVDEVEEISEDDEDRLADVEKAVLEEAARAAAEAEASLIKATTASSSSSSATVTVVSNSQRTDQIGGCATNTTTSYGSVTPTSLQSSSHVTPRTFIT